MTSPSRVDAAGLTAAEAAHRLTVHGANQIASGPGSSVPAQVLEQLRDPMILVLLLAAVLTVVAALLPGLAVRGLFRLEAAA
jgi:Ca2+-transporting ATPase